MSKRQRLFGVEIDAVRMNDAVNRILEWIHRPVEQCEFVVTPNVDHTVLLDSNPDLRKAYANAGLVLADGHPVVLASKLLRKPLPERVPGSDLVPRLFSAADQSDPITVFLLGAAPGVADKAADNIKDKWQNVYVVGTCSPPIGFEHNENENRNILDQVEQLNPDVLIVGLGAPKQELWVNQHRSQIRAKAALCVGATIDFLAGEKQRAPRWIQSIGLEWLHRISTDPGRLIKRYTRDALIFPQLVYREWVNQKID